MPDNNNQTDNPLPGGAPPPAAEMAPAAERAVEKAEEAAQERAGGTLVPNVPVEGIRESQTTGTVPGPAGEARPSVDVPTYAPPEQAGPLIGIPVADLPPKHGKVHERLLAAEQRIAWFLQHQPFPIPGGARVLHDLHARLHQERHKDEPDAAVAEQAEALIGQHNLPEVPKPARSEKS